MIRCSPNPGDLLQVVNEFPSGDSLESLSRKTWLALCDLRVVHIKGESLMLVSFNGFSSLGNSIVKIVSANGITYCFYKTLEENCEIVR